MSAFEITWVATGGTIAKKYQPDSGQLAVDNATVGHFLKNLRLPDIKITEQAVCAVDSLDMQPPQRQAIVDAIAQAQPHSQAVLITHGTDTMVETCQFIAQRLKPTVPIVVTGAMIPLHCADSDGGQNIQAALMACRLLSAGIYIVMHGRVLLGTQAQKNHQTLTFEPI